MYEESPRTHNGPGIVSHPQLLPHHHHEQQQQGASPSLPTHEDIQRPNDRATASVSTREQQDDGNHSSTRNQEEEDRRKHRQIGIVEEQQQRQQRPSEGQYTTAASARDIDGQQRRRDDDDGARGGTGGAMRIKSVRRSMQIFGTPPVGIIGKHRPREVVRIERDYSEGEICQFVSSFPLEFEGRITPTQHLKTINELNAILASAFDPYKSIWDNLLAVFTLYLSTWLLSSHYDRQIALFDAAVERANRTIYNAQGLNILDPRSNGYLFLEIEYY